MRVRDFFARCRRGCTETPSMAQSNGNKPDVVNVSLFRFLPIDNGDAFFGVFAVDQNVTLPRKTPEVRETKSLSRSAEKETFLPLQPSDPRRHNEMRHFNGSSEVF